MRYVIGDIQGCYDELCDLLSLIRFNPSVDEVWFTGDLVNRGPKSAEVLRLVMGLKQSARTVLGNHDFFLLRVAQGFGSGHAGDTLNQVIEQPDSALLLDWLRHQPLAVVDGDMIMVHAGLLPQWTRADVIAFAAEIETAMRAKQWQIFLRDLFGNTDHRWSDSLSGLVRARTIVNALCRLRYCDAFGVMDFAEKRAPHAAPAAATPWFSHPHRRTAHCEVIAGHWSSLGLMRAPQVTMLDSGCLWGGALTALRLDDRQIFQVPSRQPLNEFASE